MQVLGTERKNSGKELRTKMTSNGSRKMANSKSRPPLLETFKAWLCNARQHQLTLDNRLDLAALQLAHEEGIQGDADVRLRASALINKSSNSQEKGVPNRLYPLDSPMGDVSSALWYSVPYSFGPQTKSGRLVCSRKGKNATIFFIPKRSDEVVKYTLAFVSEASAADFIFSLMKHARNLGSVTSAKSIPGSQGLHALSVITEEAAKSLTILQNIIPSQLHSSVAASTKIQRWWRSLMESRRLVGSLSPLSSSPEEASMSEHTSGPNSKHRTRSTLVHRRMKTMRNLRPRNGRNAKRLAAVKIQRAVRMFLERRRRMNASARRIQRVVRAWLVKRRAAKIIVRFCRFVLQTAHRRRGIALGIIETRNDLYRRVTEDIVAFYNATQQTMLSYYPLFNVIIDQVRDCALKLNPNATLEPFGSSVTGLALPSSDLDLVVCFQSPHVRGGPHGHAAHHSRARMAHVNSLVGFAADYDWNSNLDEVAHLFCKRLSMETDWVDSAKVVGSASQPVIKLTCHPRMVPAFSIQVDLTLWHPKHTGVQNCRLVRDYVLRYYPQVGPLVIVIKQYLRECKLNSVYTGGLSSISLAIMVWVLVRDHPEPWTTSLGEFLLTFFATFGEEGFFSRYGVSANQGIYCLSHVEERQQDFHPPATIDDPLREGNNLAAGMFRVAEVSSCFRQACRILSDSKDMHPLSDLLRCRPVPNGTAWTLPLTNGHHGQKRIAGGQNDVR